MTHPKIFNKNSLKEFRKELRNNLTPAEAILWKALQRKQLEGRKFRRQHSIGNYIVDFYCASEKLVIELDGAGHFTPEGSDRDEKRDAYLNNMGLQVIRFENRDIFNNLDAVLELIKSNFKK
jgi:very-short-patch-repair endonuclease